MTDNAPKQETAHGDAVPETASATSLPLFFEEVDGRFYALLPSGKRPEIRKVVPPEKLRDIIAAHKKPKVPMVDVQPEGVGIAQRFPNPKDPQYQRDVKEWRDKYMFAMMMRCVFDGLVVPDANEWTWLLGMTGVSVPESGHERVRLYAQEKHPEFWDKTKWDEITTFVAAVQQITLPSEAGINIARGRFRGDVEASIIDGSQTSPGGVLGRSGDGGVEDS